ncbi:MAG: hypothetical protein ACXWUN_00405 [Allosphingosinicella sp.]
MSRMIKDYVEIRDRASLDDMIARLIEIRDSLPAKAEAEFLVRGDDVFGRHLCVAYMRPLTDEEARCEGRYLGARPSRIRRAA